MAGGSGLDPDDTDKVRAQILQTTLAEVSGTRRRRRHRHGTGGADALNDGGNEGSTGNDGDDSAVNTKTDDDCCVICLDTISEPCTARPCGHSHFDFLCLLSWLQQRASCPLCQSAVYKVGYTDTDKRENFYRVPNAPRKRNVDGEHESDALEPSARGIGGIQTASPEAHFLLRHRPRPRHHRQRRDPLQAPVTLADSLQNRRHVYQHQLYSLHVGSNSVSKYRQPPTPAQFAGAPHLVSRARMWIRRELQVFAFLSLSSSGGDGHHPDEGPAAGGSSSRPGPGPGANGPEQTTRRRNNAEFLLEYIVAILKTVDVQDSAGQAEDMLADFLGREEARLFLHELRSWLRSPCQSLAAWDREVQYPDVQRGKRPLPDGEGEDEDRRAEALDDRGRGRENRPRPSGFAPDQKRRRGGGSDAGRDAHRHSYRPRSTRNRVGG